MQSDLTQNAEHMLEELTERNGVLEMRVETLTAQVHELELLRDVNQELEETHTETEAQLQKELQEHERTIASLRAAAQAHAAQLADSDAAIALFRELVREQFQELEKLRGQSQANAPAEVRAPVVEIAPSHAHLRAMVPELERLDALQAQHHLDIVRNYLPPLFWKEDEPAIGTLLVLERIGGLSALLERTLGVSADVQDRYQARTLDQSLLTACTVRHALAHLTALAEQAAAALSTAPPDVFVAQGRHYLALVPVEQQLRAMADALHQNRFDEAACKAMCDAIVPQLENVSSGLQEHTSLADLAAKEVGSASLAALDVDTLLVGVGLAQGAFAALAPRIPDTHVDVPPQLDALAALVRRARIPASKMVRRLSALREEHSTVEMECIPALPGLGQLSSTLAARAAHLGEALDTYAERVQVEAVDLSEATLGAVLPDDVSSLTADVQLLVDMLDTLYEAVADPMHALPSTYTLLTQSMTRHHGPCAPKPCWRRWSALRTPRQPPRAPSMWRHSKPRCRRDKRRSQRPASVSNASNSSWKRRGLGRPRLQTCVRKSSVWRKRLKRAWRRQRLSSTSLCLPVTCTARCRRCGTRTSALSDTPI